jgi:hypothetical protein
MFVIVDEVHAEWCGQFHTFEQALADLETRSRISWDCKPNVPPCTSWGTCRRRYVIVEFDDSREPWRQISRTPVLTVSSKGASWDKGFGIHVTSVNNA